MNKIRRTLVTTLLLAVTAIAMSVSWAAAPPVWVNYQGVLRDDGNNPLDGTYDMVFRFYSGLDEEIMIDRHTAAQGGAVTVSGGLFNALLGAGSTADGSGPGSYNSLGEVFRDYNEVHLEVQIGADGAPGTEVLTPRTRVMSSAYALNASNLAGLPATSLLRSNDSDAYTFGTLTFNPTTTLDLDGTLQIDGAVTKTTTDHVANFNADLLDNMDSSAFAAAAHLHTGGEITGPVGEASNADLLDAKDSSFFLDTSNLWQTKNGPLTLDALAQSGSVAMTAKGERTGGYFHNASSGTSATLAHEDMGVRGFGNEAGGYFDNDTTAGHHAIIAYRKPTDGHRYGVWAQAADTGGYFQLDDGTAKVSLAHREPDGTQYGAYALGREAGGYFEDSDGTGHAYVGYFDEGISAHGTVQGGYFEDDDSTGRAHLAYGDRGIEAYGASAGGYFEDSDSGSSAYAASGLYGIYASGDQSGGYFTNPYSGNFASVADISYGITATGDLGGGVFRDMVDSGFARVGYSNYGIQAHGSVAGGHFEDTADGSETWVATTGYGVWAHGEAAAGYFVDLSDSGTAYVANGDYGIRGWGDSAGGVFSNTTGSVSAHLGYLDRGIWGRGNFAGGTFSYPDDITIWADVAKWDVSGSHYTITGNGQKNFVQNHPADASKIIVYASLEGDEVGTYTRGTARLTAGEARVALGETFRWVTHPDVGLTAQVTPRSADAVVYVASVTTEELVVRNVAGFSDDAAFDYIVHGLRIGFEHSTAIRDKQREAPIPDDGLTEAFYANRPELRAYTPLARFAQMTAEVDGVSPEDLDLSASTALKGAIRAAGSQGMGKSEGQPPASHRPALDRPSEPTPQVEESSTVVVGPTPDPEKSQEEDAAPPSPYPTFPMSGPFESGDVLVMDPEHPGMLIRATIASDPAVVGIVAGESVDGVDGAVAPVAGYGFVVVKADAGFGEIRPGDLLTSSFTAGHAMRAVEVVPGTIIGKALEPLEAGTGLIKVLVMPR